jgi:DNA-binding LytR/AlgR family response regulator
MLKGRHFIRISKTMLANIYKIKSVSNGLNFRLTAEMLNDEKLIISRHYRGALLTAVHALAKEAE